MTKKETELGYLNWFKSKYQNFPRGEIKEFESPDFLIQTENMKIGIEMVQLYNKKEANGILIQEIESIGKQIIVSAKNEFEKTEKSDFELQVVFCTDPEKPRISKSKFKSIAQYINDFAHKNISRIPFIEENELIPEITRISMYRIPGLLSTGWDCPFSGWIENLNCEKLKRYIEEKEIKYKGYKDNADIIWLLMIADSFKLSSSFNIDGISNDCSFTTNFEKIILFECFSGNYFEFNIQKTAV